MAARRSILVVSNLLQAIFQTQIFDGIA